MLLLIVNLLHGLSHVTLQLGMRVRGLRHALLQRRVGVRPRAPHLVGALRDQVVNVTAKALGGGTGG